jgi:hypothetical protein
MMGVEDKVREALAEPLTMLRLDPDNPPEGYSIFSYLEAMHNGIGQALIVVARALDQVIDKADRPGS